MASVRRVALPPQSKGSGGSPHPLLITPGPYSGGNIKLRPGNSRCISDDCAERAVRIQSPVPESRHTIARLVARQLTVLLLLLLVNRPTKAQTFASAAPQAVITLPELTEASGLVASRQNPGVLWTHNDSGSGATVFALSTNGVLLGRCYDPFGFGGNYEDIALGPGANP